MSVSEGETQRFLRASIIPNKVDLVVLFTNSAT